MNKIRVNMAVEPNDIQTLHCSQYDTEERKFSVDLHENGVGVSPSSISNQLVYKSFKGGTEQILPTNTSTPSTSPIIADIQYKDGLREDEEFLYRESPSDVDGYAKIKEIRGNTLVWNQLVQNGDFADTSVWVGYSGTTISVSNNIATVGCATAYGRIQQNISFINGHKYLIFASVKKTNASDAIRLYYGNHLGGGSYVFADNTNWQTLSTIKTAVETTTVAYPNVENTVANLTWQQKNMMIFDLTQMGLDTLTASEFTSLFPLSYYAYDSGSLLSFNGSGIKTTGKNFIDTSNVDTQSTLVSKNIDGSLHFKSVSVAQWDNKYLGEFLVLKGTQYRITVSNFKYGRLGFSYANNTKPLNSDLSVKDMNGVPLSSLISNASLSSSFNVNYTGYVYVWYCSDYNIAQSQDFDTNIQVSFDDVPVDYEPYEEHTLSLPISAYFPTGLKSAGSIYDELDETGYITRVGEVDLGSLAWYYDSGTPRFISYGIQNNAKVPLSNDNVANIKCTKYTSASLNTLSVKDKVIALSTGGVISIKDTSAGTDPSAFQSSLSGNKLYYELGVYLNNYGVVDLGMLTYYIEGGNFIGTISDLKNNPYTSTTLVCSKYITSPTTLGNMPDKSIRYYGNTNKIIIKDSSYNDATAFKSAMSGVYLLYEKSNPQGLKTASIVTNYGEMPLYNDNGELKADCIADVSENSGFQIAKVKLKDENGEIYSNPFQIHTERSPQ